MGGAIKKTARPARRAARTAEQPELGLQQSRDRLSTETTEQRDARLQQMSLRQHDRLANESCMATEERDTRICRMSTLQRQRLDKQRLHQEERESSSQLVNNSSVQTKMRAFHGHFATFTSPKCSTCLQFPWTSIAAMSHPTTECMHCCRDKHSLYLRCTLLPTTRIQARYHPNYRLVHF